MNSKLVISFVALTIVLVLLSWALLDIIDKHLGIWLAISVALMVVADILLMCIVFLRLMRPPTRSNP